MSSGYRRKHRHMQNTGRSLTSTESPSLADIVTHQCERCSVWLEPRVAEHTQREDADIAQMAANAESLETQAVPHTTQGDAVVMQTSIIVANLHT